MDFERLAEEPRGFEVETSYPSERKGVSDLACSPFRKQLGRQFAGRRIWLDIGDGSKSDNKRIKNRT